MSDQPDPQEERQDANVMPAPVQPAGAGVPGVAQPEEEGDA